MKTVAQTVIEAGRFYTIAAKGGSVIQAVEEAANGGDIRLGKYEHKPEQEWAFVREGDGVYRIRNRASGKLIDLMMTGTANGTWLHLWEDVGGTSQMWTVEPTPAGTVRLRSSWASGKCIDTVGMGAAQQHHEIRQGQQADDGNDAAEHQRREEAGGSEPGGSLGVLAAEAAADDAAGTVAQHEAQCLDDGHQAGNNAHGTGGAGGDLPHKEGIRQIVDAGDQHAQDGGGRKAQDQFRDGSFGHFTELCRTSVFRCHEKTSLSLVI